MNALKALSLSLFVLAYHVSANTTACKEASCEPGDLFSVRFPFRLRDVQPPRCGYDRRRGRFDLSCNNRSQTVIRLDHHGSGSDKFFEVKRIDYEQQSIWINDPDECLPRRFLNQEFTNFSSDTFHAYGFQNYVFLDCSADIATAMYGPLSLIPCLGTRDRAVVALPAAMDTAFPGDLLPESASPAASPAPQRPERCSVLGVASVPVTLQLDFRPLDLGGDIWLTWRVPDCRDCAARGGVCGYRSGAGSEIGCSVSLNGSTTGLPRSAKYGIIIGVGIPGLLCIIGLASYICGRVRTCGRRRQFYSDHAGLGTPEPVVVVMGLDGPTIESFPKIELGESKRLPKPNDNTCPICLSEYQPKETLRTIPECNHYFHATCVDEWLKMNATCPLCRNSPEGSSHVTPSTSVSSSSSSLSSP